MYADYDVLPTCFFILIFLQSVISMFIENMLLSTFMNSIITVTLFYLCNGIV